MQNIELMAIDFDDQFEKDLFEELAPTNFIKFLKLWAIIFNLCDTKIVLSEIAINFKRYLKVIQ